MNFGEEKLDAVTTKEEAMTLLKESVKTRDAMGGAMYFNILNDDCCEIAGKAKSLGGDHNEIADILGRENFK